MDLNQRKLTKSEWDAIEVPTSDSEKKILNFLNKAYNDVNLKENSNLSLLSILKIDYNDNMEAYLYKIYFQKKCQSIEDELYKLSSIFNKTKIDSQVKITSADKIRLERFDVETIQKFDVYEYVLIQLCDKFVHYKKKEIEKMKKKPDYVPSKIKSSSCFQYYTLHVLSGYRVQSLNKYVMKMCHQLLKLFESTIDLSFIIRHSYEFIECNELITKYQDLQLYSHQQTLFHSCRRSFIPKLILYIAPTGTGKTLSPIPLLNQYKIIFVCAARHVGLALARAAITMDKKIAFAFGCNSADDIRLHYFAAKDYIKNKRSGGIGKVDNSAGDNVEMIISDIKSFLPAMYYLREFNKDENGEYRYDNLLVYWDEPTITLDYENHEIHDIIKNNWKNNFIPNMILSSATLPKCNEIASTISDFQCKFSNDSHEAELVNIESYDCKKTINLIDNNGYSVCPHHICETFEQLQVVSEFCSNNLSLIRYMDLKSISEFIMYVNENNLINANHKIDRHFYDIREITMNKIKYYYINTLSKIYHGTWGSVYVYFKNNRNLKIVNNTGKSESEILRMTSVGPGIITDQTDTSGQPMIRMMSESQVNPNMVATGKAGVYLTTKDAYTLKDGPTIYITNQIEKMAKFCIQQASIPSIIIDEIMKKIAYNNSLNEKIDKLEKEVECIKEQAEKNVSLSNEADQGNMKRNKSSKDSKKFNREMSDENYTSFTRLTQQINELRNLIKRVSLNDVYVPNKQSHIQKWSSKMNTDNAFTSNIDEVIVSEIMTLHSVDDLWKIMLMMGIGVFINHENIKYTEIMKKLADEQKLYIIIASSDYIYGTNYQFCHGYISKDLVLTQEKIIQAMGRVGRTSIQQEYTIRFRDNEMIKKLFTPDENKIEVINMNRLFNSDE
jgi:hypothetical protein